MKWLVWIVLSFAGWAAAPSSEQNLTNSIHVYRWIVNDRPNRNLQILLKSVEHDRTLLCPDRLQIRPLKQAIEAMLKAPVEINKLEVERLADSLLRQYIRLRNSGCYTPKDFYESEEFAAPKTKPADKIIVNPILERLEKALQRYRKIALHGGWKPIKIKDELYLYPQKAYPEIPAIKERLKIEGFFDGALDGNTTYDTKLKEAVMDFQLHHGLKPDGIIGPLTLEAMNRSVEEKIRTILYNIERMRWFLQDDDYFVFVNIPGFFLEVYEKGEPIFHCKVVVGRKKRPTPMMRDEIAYAVLNPYWRAPKTIIAEDILPELKKGNFEKLRKEGIIATTDYMGKEVIDFEDVNWSVFDNENVPFYFLQQPGPHNFLGYLKLIFPNRFDVYLHDTNHRNLFRYNYRALSSGCIRLEKPIELYHLLASKERELTYRDIFDIIWKKKTKQIPFKQRIPVYLLYLTTYVDEKNGVYFYKDIYGYDKRMRSAIKASDTSNHLLEARW